MNADFECIGCSSRPVTPNGGALVMKGRDFRGKKADLPPIKMMMNRQQRPQGLLQALPLRELAHLRDLQVRGHLLKQDHRVRGLLLQQDLRPPQGHRDQRCHRTQLVLREASRRVMTLMMPLSLNMVLMTSLRASPRVTTRISRSLRTRSSVRHGLKKTKTL